MRVLYHHRTQGEEPESIHIESIVGALRELGHEVRIVGPVEIESHGRVFAAPATSGAAGSGKSGGLLPLIKRSVPRAVLELLQVAYTLVAWRLLDRAIREFRPDVIYERYALFSFAGVALARRRGVPL